MAQNKNKKNRVRIIAGEWRGRLIDFPDIPELRPSSDRIKETVFNWLTPHIHQCSALDLFAGSGALGIEALSRGASSACFVEKNKAATISLTKNLEKLNASSFQIINQDALTFIETQKLDTFDLIFLDPPYAFIDPSMLIKKLSGKLSQAKECHLFYEHNSEILEETLPENWRLLKQKRAGQVYFHLLLHKPKA